MLLQQYILAQSLVFSVLDPSNTEIFRIQFCVWIHGRIFCVVLPCVGKDLAIYRLLA